MWTRCGGVVSTSRVSSKIAMQLVFSFFFFSPVQLFSKKAVSVAYTKLAVACCPLFE